MILPYLYIGPTELMGRGVFTGEAIKEGTVVEVAPVIVMTKEEREWLDKTLLYFYIFEWGEEKDKCCMALGYVPIYNHSFESNCEHVMDYEQSCIRIIAMRDIAAGEQLFINYNGDWNDPRPLWFDAR